MIKADAIGVSIENARMFADRLEYNLGYSRGIAGVAILFLVIFYVITFIGAFSLFKPFGRWWYPAIPAACVVFLHLFLYYLRVTGDQTVVIIQKPVGIAGTARYEVIHEKKIVASGNITPGHIRVESYETSTGLYHNTPAVHYRVVLLPKGEESLVLYRNSEQGKCLEQAGAILQYVGLQKPNSSNQEE